MKKWTCSECGHEVIAKNTPKKIEWSDGHVCKEWHCEPIRFLVLPEEGEPLFFKGENHSYEDSKKQQRRGR